MAATTSIEFFGTSSVSAPNIGTGWQFQTGGALQRTRTRSNELDDDGDEILSGLSDEKISTTFNYVFKQPSTALTAYQLPAVGDVKEGWMIDSFTITWSRDQLAAKLALNCHRHAAATAHDAGRTYTPSLATIAPPSFGCPTAFGTAFALAQGTVIALRSATYTCQVNHVDENGGTGSHLAGNNYDASETLQVELTGKAGADDYTTTWDMPSDTTSPANTGATTTSLTFEHHLAHDTATT